MDMRMSKESAELEVVRYDKSTGLVPVVVQDVTSGEVLMLAYANREALKRTLGTGQAWFWSRSRQDYWRKGATSGNVQRVAEVRVDCDGDTVLYLVEPAGPACHTGELTCFYRAVKHGDDKQSLESHPSAEQFVEATVLAENQTGKTSALEPSDIDWRHPQEDFASLLGLWNVIADRYVNRPQGSYTTYLFEHGVDKIAKKVGEEAAEVVIAAKNAAAADEPGHVELAKESADLLYHLFALWRECKISPDMVFEVLRERAK